MTLKSLQQMTTQELLTRWRGGDANAREALLARHLPALRRLAHNRLPAQARDLAATEDLVQATVIKVLHHLDGFRSDEPGALLAYLRTALMNTLRDELRRCKRLPNRVDAATLAEDPAQTPTPIQTVLTEQALAAYEQARSHLKPRDQQLISLRIEFGMSYEEIADLAGMKTANAVRMRVSRALLQLAELIDAEAIRP